MNSFNKKIIIIWAFFLLMMLVMSCSNVAKENKKIVIADQFGLGYAPIQLMKAKGFLEENLPNYEIEWVKMGNASTIREAMITGDLDVGFMGIPPFLIGVDHDTPWKIFTGLSEAPLGLVSKKGGIVTLKDIGKNDQIILPQPGSIQHILLQMAAKKELNNAKKFDEQLLTMNHGDGMNALIADNELNLHFTSPPYLYKELELENTHLLLDAKKAFGGSFTFIVGVSQKEFYTDQEKYEGFMKALNKSIEFINNNKEATINELSNIYDYSKEDLNLYIYNDDMKYLKTIIGIERFAKFMHEEKMIDQAFGSEELIWEEDETLD